MTAQKVEITVLYGGPSFDPAESDNKLSYMVLKNTMSDLRYTASAEDGFSNCFQCIISERSEAEEKEKS